MSENRCGHNVMRQTWPSTYMLLKVMVEKVAILWHGANTGQNVVHGLRQGVVVERL